MSENKGKKPFPTSLRVDSELWKKAKIYCINNNLTLGKLVEKLLREELRENE